MKTVLDADRQLSSDDRALRGRRFVEFVALVLVCAVREVWRNLEKLREALNYMFAIFEEMKSIHYIEHTGHPGRLTLFVGKRLLICDEFKVTVPDECKPNAKKNTETKASVEVPTQGLDSRRAIVYSISIDMIGPASRILGENLAQFRVETLLFLA